MIRYEPKALLFKGHGVQFSGACALFLWGLAVHADDDAAVGEGVGEWPMVAMTLGPQQEKLAT